MGMVKAENPVTRINIFNLNTNAKIEVIIQTPAGDVTYEGDGAIDGVPGTAAPVKDGIYGSYLSISG